MSVAFYERQQARRLLAAGRGAPKGECDCAVCGPGSPFAPHPQGSKRVFGSNFTSYPECWDSSLPNVCQGCTGLLLGRPGDDPPPLRTMHALATEQGVTYPGTKEISMILREPPQGPHVLLWTASRQRHTVLHAGLSTPERQAIGSETGPIVVHRHDLAVLDAVEHMLGYCTRAAVASGSWDPMQVARAGVAWVEWEAIVSPHVGTQLLDLFTAVGHRIEAPPETPRQPKSPAGQMGLFSPSESQEVSVIPPEDEAAIRLLMPIIEASEMRRQDGLRFWRGLLVRRLRARMREPLDTMVSRLMADWECSPMGSASAADMLASLEAHEREAISETIRERPDVIAAHCFARWKEVRDA